MSTCIYADFNPTSKPRLLKIEDTLESIIGDLEIMDRLSFREKQYAANVNNLNNKNYEDEFLSKLQEEELRDLVANPSDRIAHSQPQLDVRMLGFG
jgi:hypothetical protein